VSYLVDQLVVKEEVVELEVARTASTAGTSSRASIATVSPVSSDTTRLDSSMSSPSVAPMQSREFFSFSLCSAAAVEFCSILPRFHG
jgi:hypothetical protein